MYLRIHLVPEEMFERQGNDLYVSVPIDLFMAVLGGEAMVETPDRRKLILKIPPETQNNQAFRLRKQGMPVVGNPSARGDLIARVQVVLPKHLSPEEKGLFRRLAESRTKEQKAA